MNQALAEASRVPQKIRISMRLDLKSTDEINWAIFERDLVALDARWVMVVLLAHDSSHDLSCRIQWIDEGVLEVVKERRRLAFDRGLR